MSNPIRELFLFATALAFSTGILGLMVAGYELLRIPLNGG